MNKGKLYLVPTPIGNLGDITSRSLDVLNGVNILICEDTRVTLELLKTFKIPQKKLISSHKFNEQSRVKIVLDYLSKGENVALLTDRGTPIISDPGNIIVKEVIESNYEVIPLPGATAFVPALIASTLSAEHFLFYGFLKGNKEKIKKDLDSLKLIPYTIIFYETPHHFKQNLKLIYEVFGPRKASVAREISKLHESFYYGNIEELLNMDIPLKGEFVIVIEGNNNIINFGNLSISDHIKIYEEDGLEKKEAMKKVAKDLGISKSDVYKKYLKENE